MISDTNPSSGLPRARAARAMWQLARRALGVPVQDPGPHRVRAAPRQAAPVDDSLASGCAHVPVEDASADGGALIRCADCGTTLRLWSAHAAGTPRGDSSDGSALR